jgi:hypothetical protein
VHLIVVCATGAALAAVLLAARYFRRIDAELRLLSAGSRAIGQPAYRAVGPRVRTSLAPLAEAIDTAHLRVLSGTASREEAGERQRREIARTADDLRLSLATVRAAVAAATESPAAASCGYRQVGDAASDLALLINALLEAGCRDLPEPSPVPSQGPSSQGQAPRGLSYQSRASQGLSSQGLSPQGLSPQGLSPQGQASQGLSPQSLSSQGQVSQGQVSQGQVSQGQAPRGPGSSSRQSRAAEARQVLPIGPRG